MNMIDLDKISAVASSIRYTVISGLETSVVVSWTEKSVQRTRCGFCKYNLTPELDLLDLVNEYSFAEHAVLSLSCFDGWFQCMLSIIVILLSYAILFCCRG